MKKLTRSAALILAAVMMLTAASCKKDIEETTEESLPSESIASETASAEPSESETTVESSEETTESEETEASEIQFDYEASDLDGSEYPFLLSEDVFAETSDALGAAVYYNVDDFIDMTDRIKLREEDAMNTFHDGIAIVASGHDHVAELIEDFGDPSSGDADVTGGLTSMCLFTAADPADDGYQVIVVYYEAGDDETLTTWYKRAVSEMMENLETTFPSNDMFESSVSLYENSDSRAFLAKYLITDSFAESGGYPKGSGAYVAFYTSGNRAVFITLREMGEDKNGLNIMRGFCDEMGIISPELA